MPRRLALVLTVAFLAFFAAPGIAFADESISSYDVSVTLAADGTFHVREALTYDFGSSQRHGITRSIPIRYTFDDTHDRVVDVSNISVTSATGAPTEVTSKEENGTLILRVGDPNKTITGPQQYVLEYDVSGATNAFTDHAEIYWNAIGPEWSVSMNAVRVSVRGPASPTQVACFAGPSGSGLACSSALVGDGRATFSQDRLEPYQGLTISVAFPVSSVTVPAPVLVEKFSVDRAFEATPWTIGGGIAVLLAGLGGVGFIGWSRGRDRRWRGQIPGLAPPGSVVEYESTTEHRPLFADKGSVVEFAPAPDVRPGEIGTLMDERVDPLDVTATIVDLAVRGYLHIEELPREHFFTSHDWLLSQRKPVDIEVRDYEKLLLDELFLGRPSVNISALKRTFGSTLVKAEKALYERVVSVGWFSASPELVRTRWSFFGGVCVALGAGLTYLLAKNTHAGLLGVAAVLVGLVLMRVARRMPARTAKGSAALAQALGFRQYIQTAEAEQLRFEERADVFSRYLPYAIVFGETDRWAKAFASLGSGQSGGSPLGWYTGPVGWNFGNFGSSMQSFSDTTGGAVAATAASSGGSGFSGGSSGGGFGGGGGGSW